jgi:hypothetical protein
MDEPAIDLHDYRRRLLRLAIALVVAAGFTVLTMTGIHAFSGTPDKNPIAGSTPAFVAIIIYVMSVVGAHLAVCTIDRRLQRRARSG